MQNNSFISSFKSRVPLGLILAVVFIVTVELFVRSTIGFVADRNTLCLEYKYNYMNDPKPDDVVIFGLSRSMVLDGAKLGKVGGRNLSVFNCSVPNLDTSQQFYLLLKKYLSTKPIPPRLVMLAVPQEVFSGYNVADDFSRVRAGDFRRIFDPLFMLLNVDMPEKSSFLKNIYSLRNIVPTFNFRGLIALHLKRWRQFFSGLGDLATRNSAIISQLRATGGQMFYNEDEELMREDALAGLPPSREIFLKSLRPNTYIEEFIQLARMYSIKVVMFDTPLPAPRYYRLRDLGYIDYIRSFMGNLTRRYDNFSYFAIQDIYYKCEFFGDWSHLNRKGAARFNKEFAVYFEKILQEAGM